MKFLHMLSGDRTVVLQLLIYYKSVMLCEKDGVVGRTHQAFIGQCANWIAMGMRPLSNVEDDGFVQLFVGVHLDMRIFVGKAYLNI